MREGETKREGGHEQKGSIWKDKLGHDTMFCSSSSSTSSGYGGGRQIKK